MELPDRDPFTVDVSHGVLGFVPDEDGAHLSAHVEEPLSFVATAATVEQGLRIDGGSFVAGAITLPEGAAVVRLRSGRPALRVRVRLGGRSPDPGPRLVIEVGPIGVLCDGIHASSEVEASARDAGPLRLGHAELRIVAEPPLSVRPVRSAPAEVVLHAVEPDALLPVFVVDRQRGWARVALSFSDGSRVEGWTAEDALRGPTAIEAEEVEQLLSARTRASPRNGDPVEQRRNPAAASGTEPYLGAATLEPGSHVFVGRGAGAWAQSPAREVEVRVRHAAGEPYAELVDVDGMRIEPHHAWVDWGALAIRSP